MREKIKCPQCGLVQWREAACKRCSLDFTDPEAVSSKADLSAAANVPAAAAEPPQPRTPLADSSYAVIFEDTIQELERGLPWMRFLTILGRISATFQFVAACLVAYLAGTYGIPGGAQASLFFLFAALMYLGFSKRLNKGAKAIARVRAGGGADALPIAVRHQSAVWKLLGVSSLLATLLITVILVLVVLIGIQLR